MHCHAITAILAIALLAPIVRADEEASNRTYVQSGEYGSCYAKSIPAESYGSKGTTRVYLVREKEDLLELTFDWYAPQIALQGTSKGLAVIRFGSWPRGHVATPDELAIAFYLNGKLLHSYSTLDIAGKPENVSFSVSHYRVIKKQLGFRWIEGNTHAYYVQTTDGRVISFNIDTGEIMSTTSSTAPAAKP
jgi:hypothetical protein